MAKTKTLGEQLRNIQATARENQIHEQVESFKNWVENEMPNELIEEAKTGKHCKQYKMEQFYFHGINTHDNMIHHLKSFCEREGIHSKMIGGTALEISWRK